MIDFNDLIPGRPKGGLIDFNDLVPTSQTVEEEPEPTAEDLEIYRRMGLNEYVSPSSRRYPLGMPKEAAETRIVGETAYPGVKPDMLAAARRAMAGEEVPEKTIQSVPIGNIPVARPTLKKVVSAELPSKAFVSAEASTLIPDSRIQFGYEPRLATPEKPIAEPKEVSLRPKEYVPLEEKLGLPEIFKGIREMIAPTTEYTREEWKRQLKETPEKLLWMAKYIPTLGGRLGGKDFRKKLLEQAEEFAGFGPALAPAGGELNVLLLEWGVIYPTLFKAVGMGGEAVSKIPRVAKAAAAIKKMGGLEKLAEKFPRAYARTANVVKAMTKGAGVGGFMGAAETIGKEMELDEILQHTGKNAALMAGITGVFQAASEYDTATYISKLRKALISASNSHFAAKLQEVSVIPDSPYKSRVYGSLVSMKKTELNAIDRIVSATEANLLKLKQNKMYQLGQEVVERPERAAQRMMRYGLEKAGEIPVGVKGLRKGMGETEPFIKMPMTRTAEAIESAKELGAMLRKPSQIAERILRTKLPAKPAKVTPPPVAPTEGVKPWTEPIERPGEVTKRRRVEILPRKTEILTQIDEAIKKAPSETELRSSLQKEIPEPASNLPEQEYFRLLQEKSKRIAEEVENIKSKKVKFEIDGGASIINTKEALTNFRADVQKLPDTELWPKAVAHKVGKKKPIAATKEKIGELVKAPAGWFTDGRILVKGEPPAKAKRVEDWEERKTVNIDDIIHAPTEPAEFQHYAVSDPTYGEGISDRPVAHIEEPGTQGPIAVFKSGGKYFAYDQDMYNVIRNRFPDAEYGVKADTGLLVVYMGRDKPVAAMMGITVDEAEGPGMVEPPVELKPLPKEVEPTAKAERQFKLINAHTNLQERYEGQTGTYIKTEDELIGVRFDDGKEYYFYPDQVEEVKPTPAEVKAEPAKPTIKQFEILNSRGQRYGGLFESREKAQKFLEKRITSAAGRLQFTIQEAPAEKKKPVPETVTKAKESQQLYDELIEKWGDDAVAEAQEFLSEEDDTYQEIETKFVDLDSAGKGQTQEAQALERQLLEMVDDYLSAKPEKPTEEPSLFVPPKPAMKPKLSFEDLVPRPEDVKHIENVVVDTFREWPKGIKKVGKDYWTEVMATAKQLSTPYRYKALRQTMLGVFRYKKETVPQQVVGIEIQDVTDALTATHELGHNIDWLLNNKIFPSSIKGRFPSATVGEMSLRNELKKISQILRPDMWVSPKAYIKGHVELMADYIAHYILDPEKTMELAPNLTRAFEAKLADKPDLFEIISRLQESRYTGPEEPPIAGHIREVFPLPKDFKPLQLAIDMTDKDYIKAAEELGITAVRHYKVLIQRAQTEADRIDRLIPNKDRQTDLVVIAENGSQNPWTGKSREEILKEGLTAAERKAINLFRAYQEQARQTVNKYLRGADIAEYIKFIEDYFIHAYETPLTEKYKAAIARWAKRSPQAKKRVLPDLAKAVELGLKPRARTLSEGLMLWSGINYRVMTNKAFLRILPNITNDDGVSILQKPQDYPSWPTVDFHPIRQTYSVPLPGRGILLFQGRVAVDPRVKPFIDAMFGRRSFHPVVRVIEGLNAIWKSFELTLFSLFHHFEEFFSAVGSLGPRAMPFVGGYYGKRAQAFGKKPKLWGFLPAHINTLKAGKQLEQCPEFMEDYLAHGGQTGYITTEGITLIERMLKRAADYLENIIQYKPTTPLTGVYAALYVPVKTAHAAYSFHQSLLWDNVNRAKLVTYYHIVADGAKHSNLPIKDVKEIAVKYIADNYGGREWLNDMFRNPKTRQFWTQLMMSLDWTWSQIRSGMWPFRYGGKTEAEKARLALMRRIGHHHWFWYLAAIVGFTIAGNYALNGKGPWENEKGHKLDIDWTRIWRRLPWNRDWKERGDYARRYMSLGKAGRELIRWVVSPLKEFGNKLSPTARTIFEQGTGYNLGADFPEPWAREDLEGYQEMYARFKHLMENFKPFSLSGNNAFLAFPSSKGMTSWKATRAYEDIYKARAIIAMGGIGGKIAKASQILKKDEEKLRAEIAEACKLNNVDANQADRAAVAGVRSKYYSLFWKATKMPEKKAVSLCNAYANALLELGVTPKGFKQSLRYRSQELPERSKELGVQLFHDVAAKK